MSDTTNTPDGRRRAFQRRKADPIDRELERVILDARTANRDMLKVYCARWLRDMHQITGDDARPYILKALGPDPSA